MICPMLLPSDTQNSGRRFGAEELDNLRQVLESGALNCTRGTFVNRLETKFAVDYGGPDWFCTAVTSGTAAIHCAVAALDLEPEDEIVTTAITDMGALAPILMQGCIPVFCDIDPLGYTSTAATIRAVLTPRTRAIVVTHLFGVPCDMDPILALAKERGLSIIEDVAQAPFAGYRGRLVGTLGDIGCFSLQQGKHMTCGEGGLVLTRDAGMARRMRLFHDKAWGYGDAEPDHYFLAPNYRMTELQGAVALAQLDRVSGVVADRRASAARFLQLVADVPGLAAQSFPSNSEPVFWKVVLRLDDAAFGADVRRVGALLKEKYGIVCAPRYVQKPAFECQIFQEKRTFGNSQWPLKGVAAPDPAAFPGTYEALNHMLVLPWNENYQAEHVHYIAAAVRATADYFRPEATARYGTT